MGKTKEGRPPRWQRLMKHLWVNEAHTAEIYTNIPYHATLLYIYVHGEPDRRRTRIFQILFIYFFCCICESICVSTVAVRRSRQWWWSRRAACLFAAVEISTPTSIDTYVAGVLFIDLTLHRSRSLSLSLHHHLYWEIERKWCFIKIIRADHWVAGLIIFNTFRCMYVSLALLSFRMELHKYSTRQRKSILQKQQWQHTFKVTWHFSHATLLWIPLFRPRPCLGPVDDAWVQSFMVIS